MAHKYKVCVYAICKNEEQFVERFMDHAKEADLVVVTDTGSTDKTVEKLKEKGAVVYEMKIDPFRFDESRNFCLNKIPEDVDICVSADMDDVIGFGWREKLEKSWTKETTRGMYLYNWSFNADGTPAVQYKHQRIHARHGYRWIYPTHEILEYIGEGKEKQTFLKGVVYSHYPDTAKDRSLNLPLLELAVREEPNSARNLHYLGREYMFCGQWEKCIAVLKKYLSPEISFWDEERSASMRFISRAYGKLGQKEEEKKWIYKAMAETPHLREPYMEMAYVAYKEENWPMLYFCAHEALKIEKKSLGYVNESFAWNEIPYDFAALALHKMKMSKLALPYSLKALAINPEDTRLKNNHAVYEKSAALGE